MTRFLLNRLAETLIVLLVMSFVIYALIGLMPGDPVDLMIASDPSLTAADAARLKSIYGLDRPLVERYLAWLGGAVQGEFGYARLNGRPVLEVLAPRLANTVLLMGLSFGLAILIAIPAGILAALRPHSLTDGTINGGDMSNMTLGVNWYCNPYSKVVFNYIHSWLDARNGLQSETSAYGLRAQFDF